MKTTHLTRIAFAFSLIVLTSSNAAASPVLDEVSFDPAFISAGDRVNISANLHATQYPDKVWDEDKHLKIVLKPGNRLTEEYVTIEDDRDESIGFLYPEGAWNQRYQVKVDSGAPTGMYDFELHIQYLENGEPVKIPTEEGSSTFTVIEKFSMPVDNEGVDLTGNVVSTEPTVPRPGNDYVEMNLRFTNTGNKPVEEITLKPSTPEYIETSYSGDEKFFINKLMEGHSATKSLALNLDEDLSPGLHWVNLSAVYEDESGNPYSETVKIPLRVEGRPDLELVESRATMKAGGTDDLHVRIKNTGSQDAESVTARVIAERSQPFSLSDRSNYVGEIEPGETAEAVLSVSADRSAALKSHELKIQLRSMGDSEEGDNSVYTFSETADVKIDGRTRSPLIYVGAVAALLVLLGAFYRYFWSSGSQNQEKEEDYRGEDN